MGFTRAFARAKQLLVSLASSSLASTEARLVADHVDRLVDYTVLGGKNARSRLVCSTFEALRPEADEREKENVVLMSTAIEFFQSSMLILDDVMDHSETRRARRCWHRMDGVGMSAVNDALMLDSLRVIVVEEAMRTHPNKDAINRAIDLAKRKTVLGQYLDGVTARHLNDFTWDRYEQIVEHKTSHYSFATPLQMGLLAADVRAHQSETLQLAYRIGFLFQAQDDYLDVFGEREVMGKEGSDLKEGKCTWITTRSRQLLSSRQDEEGLTLLREGLKEKKGKINELQELFVRLNLVADFEQFEDRFIASLLKDIESFPLAPLRPVLHTCVKQLKRRKK